MKTLAVLKLKSLIAPETDRTGFTIFEILIVLLIAGILAAIAAPSWLNLIGQQRLNTTQDQTLRAMRTAQENAKRSNQLWQVSFRQNGDRVEWAVHNAVNDGSADDSETNCIPDAPWVPWKQVDQSIRIDASNTNLGPAICPTGEWRVQFDLKGRVRDATGDFGTGQITFVNAGNDAVKRCVIVSTLLGSMRTAQNDGCVLPPP